MDTAGVITLKQAVASILNKTKRPESEYHRYEQLVIEGLTELNLYVRSYPKQTKVDMDDQGWVDLPSDFVDFVSIGIHHNGQLFTFTRNDKIIVTTSIDSLYNEYQDELEGEGVAIDNGQITGFGARGGKNEFYYKWDKGERRIYIAGFPQQTVFLTYISSGVGFDSPTHIERAVLPALTSYVMWEDAKYDREIPANQKQLLEYYFHQERRKLRSLNAPTADEWKDAIYKSYKRAVKR
jgi:hypothetical protein